MSVIQVYKITDTINSKVNEEKFNLELKTSTISSLPEAYIFGNELYVKFEDDIVTTEDKTLLDSLVSNHDGAEAETTEVKVNSRELNIRALVQMAIYHPLLDPILVNEYLTSIDNYINAYIRSGITNTIHSKILQDSQLGQPYYDFLNIIVNEHGNKTFEYFINSIQ